MRARLVTGLIVALMFAAPVGPVIAESVRLRPLSPVYVDKEGSPLRQPEGIGCGLGAVVIADSGNGRLLHYTVTEESIASAATWVTQEIPYPVHAEIVWDGEILALDGKSRRIGRLSAQGEFTAYFEPSGVSGKVVPRSFKFGRDKHVYILDIFSNRVLVVNSAGAVTRQVAFPEEFGAFADVAVDSGGRLFAIDSVDKRLYSASSDESVLIAVPHDLRGKADFPTSLAVDSAGNVYVGDQNGGSILILGPDGSFRARQSKMGWKAGQLRFPSKLCVDDKDHLFVADRANDRIQVFGILR